MFSDSMMMSGGRGFSYSIENSLLLRGGQYLSRTPTSAPTSTTTSTISMWVRFTKPIPTAIERLFTSYDSGASNLVSGWRGTDSKINLEINMTSGTTTITTTSVFRDIGWYHLVFVLNTSSETQAERAVIYVNGVREAVTGSYPPSQNEVISWGKSGVVHGIGHYPTVGQYADASFAEFCSVDGAALTPSYFGEFDQITLSWRPRKIIGITWGANGFYIGNPWVFSNLGTDYSGQGNNWTPNGFSASDVLLGSPTNVFSTMNPLKKNQQSQVFSNGNLTFYSAQTSTNPAYVGSLAASSGKWYWEITIDVSASLNVVGVCEANFPIENDTSAGYSSAQTYRYRQDGNKGNGTTWSAYGSSWTTGDKIAVALDLDNGAVYFGKIDGTTITWQNSGDPLSGPSKTGAAFTTLSGKLIAPYGIAFQGGQHSINFGQKTFAATNIPAGFKTICTSNLPTPTSAAARQPWKYYSCQTVSHNGTSSTFTIGWNPDPTNGGSHTLFRIKRTNTSGDWCWIDTVRGLNKTLYSNTVGAEATPSGTQLTVNASGDVTIGDAFSANTYLVEAWRVSQESGFDIVLYSGTGTVRSISHNNGTVPAFVVIKGRTGSVGGSQNWRVYHQSIGATKALLLSSPAAASTSNTYWNNTAPVWSQITLGTDTGVNASDGTYVAYVWSPVPGFSAFGSHAGNSSSDGPFDWLGFTPGEVTMKRTDTELQWTLWADPIDTTNPRSSTLALNSSSGQSTADSWGMDFLSGAIKMRANTGEFNAGTVAYAAWAKAPLGASNITPATAR